MKVNLEYRDSALVHAGVPQTAAALQEAFVAWKGTQAKKKNRAVDKIVLTTKKVLSRPLTYTAYNNT